MLRGPLLSPYRVGRPEHSQQQRGWRTASMVAERVNAWAGLVGLVERGYDDMDAGATWCPVRHWRRIGES
ncbi:hypothetical protein GCM10017771_08760 [Streptomyces capitiformicae]|uniref:Uncharacterized protein n=1 Tax=Streptomyces capitiformicae TaxID=2014920 RepID=A0A919GF23_9ACTN|nr:hypothetical protein GCM10017771_08760 [Streptomyces capitiformicae]